MVSSVEIPMQKAGATRHSVLYYRNTAIVWIMTVVVFCSVITAYRSWLSMLVCLFGIYLVYFMWITYRSVHPGRAIFRRKTPKLEVDLKPEMISFLSRDGLQLKGWFIPGTKQGVIILLHGLGETGLSMSYQARMLNKNGYNVLMPDMRAHGESDGDTITGVLEVNDVLGALDYLTTRPDVDEEQVGILGVSFGALVALRSASDNNAIRALVLESIGPAKLTDHGGRPTTLRDWINYSYNWLLYQLFDFMSGVVADKGVVDSLHTIYPRPVLFISTGRGKERTFMRIFFDVARHPKSILEVPKASHGLAAAVNSREYRELVLRVFDGALG